MVAKALEGRNALSVDGWTVSGWVVGAVSLGITAVAYSQQRRSAPALNKVVTDYKAQHTGAEVEQLEQTLASLEGQLRREVPAQARQAFLAAQKNLLRMSLSACIRNIRIWRRN